MSGQKKKKKHTILIMLAIVLTVPAITALILMTHTQIIVGTIQKLAAGTVNTINSYEPLGDPMELNVRNYELSVRKADAEMIEVC